MKSCLIQLSEINLSTFERLPTFMTYFLCSDVFLCVYKKRDHDTHVLSTVFGLFCSNTLSSIFHI